MLTDGELQTLPPATARPALSFRRAISLFRHSVIQNMIALWGVQIIRKILPVITMPYLGRVLGPDGLGLVAFVQGFTTFGSLLIEYGFNLSATRELARCRADKQRRAELLGSVLGAQIGLSALAIALSVAASRFIPILAGHTKLLTFGLVFCVSDSLNPYWYFQGMERMRSVAIFEVASKSAAAFAIFALVRSPGDTWMVLAIQAGASLCATGAGLWLALRESGISLPTAARIRETLHMGWPMFLFRGADNLYALGNAFVLGLFASPAVVGYYAGPEKISKAFFGLMNPIREALYPRLSNLVHDAREEAARLARIGVYVMGVGGIFLGGLVYLLAPFLVRTLLGPRFEAAIPVLRILSLLPPLMAVTHSVGFQWLLPLGMNSVINRIMVSAGLVNFSLAVILAPRYAHIGMAWTVVASEAFLCSRMVYVVSSMEDSPQLFKFSRGKR